MRPVQPVIAAALTGLLLATGAHGEASWSGAPDDSVLALYEPEELGSVQVFGSKFAPASEFVTLDRAPGEPPEQTSPEAEPRTRPIEVAPTPAAAYPVIFNEWVQHFLDFFQSGPRRGITSIWLNRSGRYLQMIQTVFKSHGLPAELAYVAMIESGFNPVAVSQAGAKGLWQFMEETGRRYGLRVDRWVDERLDPEKSTVAAALYLKDLFGQFGSWLLAKAAYNAGELKVSQALQLGRTNDFWTLTQGRFLREETKRFVPAILAATLIGSNPERYGFEVLPEPPLSYERIMVHPLVDLGRLAARSGLSLRDLARLNPELRQGITPPGSLYPLKVPPGSGPAVQQAAEKLSPGQVKAVSHVVKLRETLGAIAKRYGVTVADLIRWNRLADPARIFPGDRLMVSEFR